jgi:hypothetical protein
LQARSSRLELCSPPRLSTLELCSRQGLSCAQTSSCVRRLSSMIEPCSCIELELCSSRSAPPRASTLQPMSLTFEQYFQPRSSRLELCSPPRLSTLELCSQPIAMLEPCSSI